MINDWEYIFGYALINLNNKIESIKSDQKVTDQSEKKKKKL